MTRWLSALPWAVVLIACASLGLAPFAPTPHVIEKHWVNTLTRR